MGCGGGGGYKPRWKLALFDRPPVEGEDHFDEMHVHWPVFPAPTLHTFAREMLFSKVGGLPHGGFVIPLMMDPDFGFGPPIVGPLAE